MDWIQQWQSKLNKQNGVTPLVRTGGSRHTGLAALPHRNIHKYILDESNGLWYELQGDYYIPCLTLSAEEERPIGIWGQRHKRYLKEYKNVTYTTLLISGKLNSYLVDINEQAQERLETLIEQMKQAQGVTEQLKAENAFEWIGRMNNIRACAVEIVNTEIIYA